MTPPYGVAEGGYEIEAVRIETLCQFILLFSNALRITV